MEWVVLGPGKVIAQENGLYGQLKFQTIRVNEVNFDRRLVSVTDKLDPTASATPGMLRPYSAQA